MTTTIMLGRRQRRINVVLVSGAVAMALFINMSGSSYSLRQISISAATAPSRAKAKGTPRRGGFPRWPSDEINATTVFLWLEFAALDARLNRMYNMDNYPTLPALLYAIDSSEDAEGGGEPARRRRYAIAASGPVAKTLPADTMMRLSRILPTEKILNRAINEFDGDGYIDGLGLGRLYQTLDSGVPIPLVLDISDMTQCASNYSTMWGSVHFEELPVWSYSIGVDCPHAFGLPILESQGTRYVEMLKENASEWDATFKEWDEKYPWESKAKVAIWRGSGTGTGWRKHMGQIVTHPSVSARFGGHNPIDFYMFPPKVKGGGDESKRVPFEDHQKYRAVLDVDGNAWSSRFPRLLCMNSPVIKVAPRWLGHQDFSAAPRAHYVPAPLDGRLPDVANWTLAPENEATVRGIVRDAREWCRTHMVRRHAMEDAVFQLAAYVDMLDRGSPGWTGRAMEWRYGTVADKLFPGLAGGGLRPLTIPDL